ARAAAPPRAPRAPGPRFDLKAELIDGKDQPVKSVAIKAPFRLRVNTHQPVNFVLLVVRADGAVVVVPTNMGGRLPVGQSVLTPKEAKEFKIANILTGE